MELYPFYVSEMIEKAADIQTLEGSSGTTVQNLNGYTEPKRVYRT